MAMKKCKECGTDVSSDAKVCPKCGKDQRNFFMKHKVITFILVVIVLGVIAGVGGSNTTNNPSGDGTMKTNTATEKFTLVSDEMTSDSFSTYIQGEIKNNTDKTYSYAQVTFNVYDSSGAQIGTAVDNINNFEPNGTWRYKAIALTTDKVASYKFVEITGW